MGMEWFIILLIWLVAPFAELAAIIVLSVANSRYKKKTDKGYTRLTRKRAYKADTADIGIKGRQDIMRALADIGYSVRPADIKIQHEGPADAEVRHERPADAVTQHEKSTAWYGPGQAIVVPEDFEKGGDLSRCRRYLTNRQLWSGRRK